MELEDDSEEEVLYDILPSAYHVVNAPTTDPCFSYEDELTISTVSAAVRANSMQRLRQLVQNGCELNSPDNRGFTCLHEAARSGKCIEILQFLLQQPALNINARSWEGYTPLCLSLEMQLDDDTILTLINAGCDVTVPNNEGETPLHFAVTRSTSHVSVKLLENGACVNSQNADGYTPMHEAIVKSSLENIHMLLYYNPDMKLKSAYSHCTPFMFALDCISDVFTVEILLEYEIDLDGVYPSGTSILMHAAESHPHLVKELFKRGAHVGIHLNAQAFFFEHILLLKETKSDFLLWKSNDLHRLLDNSVFVSVLSTLSIYAGTDYAEHLHTTLLYPKIKMLTKTTFSPFQMVLYNFLLRDTDKETRLSIIHLCLSLGVYVDCEDLAHIHDVYGFGEELDIFLNLNVHIDTGRFGCKANNLLFYGIAYIDMNLKLMTYNTMSLMSRRDLFMILKYYTISSVLREPAPNNFNTVPSLKELSRDRFRLLLAEAGCTKPFGYCGLLNKLNIPRGIRDIIVLKQPLYSVSYEHFRLNKPL